MPISVSKREWILIITFVAVKIGLHLSTSTNYELHRDALLYYSLGQHLGWGFVSVPPFIGLMAKISTVIFGATTFGLRVFPALVGGLSMLLVGLLVKSFKGNLAAIIFAMTAFLLSPAYLRTSSLFQPVVFNQFFWLLSGLLIVQLILSRNEKLWMLIFLVFGIGFMNKYSITFFMMGFFIAFLISPHRKVIWSKYFLLGGLLFTGIVLPNLIWQGTHGWPVVYHMAELQRTQLIHVSILGFLIAQLTMNLPGIIVWVSGLIGFLFIKQYRNYRFISLFVFYTIAILVLLRGKAYYTLGLYPILFAMGGVVIENHFKKGLQYAIAALVLMVSLPLIPMAMPILKHNQLEAATKPLAPFFNGWEDGEIHSIPQDFADMTGWKHLGHLVNQCYDNMSEHEKETCVIFADNYGIAGSVLFYGQNHLPDPISFNDSFILWAPDSVETDHCLIYVNHELGGDVAQMYRSCKLYGEVNDPYFRENGLKVYFCTQPEDSVPRYYANRVHGFKKRYFPTKK